MFTLSPVPTRPRPLLLALPCLAAALLLSGCPPTDNDDTLPEELVEGTWNESDDAGNENPQNPEEVNELWEGQLTITGTSELCDWDEDEDWPWTGDNDNYAITVPADGFLEAVLDWNTATDYYLAVYFDVPEGTATPDEVVDDTNDNGPETYLFEDELDEDDEIVFGVMCDGGEEGEYQLRVTWED